MLTHLAIPKTMITSINVIMNAMQDVTDATYSLLYSLKSRSLVVLTAMKNETRWSTKYQIMSAKIAFDIARNSEKVDRRRERRHVSLYHILFVSNECSDLCLLTLHAGILFRVKCASVLLQLNFQCTYMKNIIGISRTSIKNYL